MQKNYPKEFLEGERIFLRRHELATAPVMFACIDSDRERMSSFLVWVQYTKSVKDSEEYIRSSQAAWQEQSIFDYGIYRKGDRAFIGAIGAHSMAWQHERAEVGYWITGSYEGKGFVTEALSLLEQELFRLGFHRIEIRCNALNLRSSAVPQRNSYKLEGTLRDHTIEMGKRRDTLIWAKLRTQLGH